ncbi:MAG: TetR family transcriptional regulator, partial [Muribaculaceae bacterium]|nr:TetR family transcriptional regulator [Muribaculaceae bacterium]
MVYKTREKLIEVARQLFVHKGLENTTMNDIANASDKGRRTIYTYFKNKKEIYNAVLEHESDKMVAGMKEIADSAIDPATKLTRFLMLRLEQGSLINSPYSVIKSLFKLDLRRMARMRRKVIDKESIMLSSILEEGIAKGVFDRDRALLAESFILR